MSLEIEDDFLISEICRLTHFRKDDPTLFNFALLAIKSRSFELGQSVLDYLQIIKKDQNEFNLFLNKVTIHKTGWFREKIHFDIIKKYFSSGDYKHKLVRILIGACSTGEEAYSIALLMEELKQSLLINDYTIIGTDIDPLSVEKSVTGIYPKEHLIHIPPSYQTYILYGEGDYEKYFTIDEVIKSKIQFQPLNLVELQDTPGLFDLIMVRNVFIYFDDRVISKIAGQISEKLLDKGLFVSGVSEKHDSFSRIFNNHQSTAYVKKSVEKRSHPEKRNLLVVDQLTKTQDWLTRLLGSQNFEIVFCRSLQVAQEELTKKKIDVILVDNDLPDGSGIEWLSLEQSKGLKIPAFVFSTSESINVEKMPLSSHTTLEFIPKSFLLDDPEFVEMISQAPDQKYLDQRISVKESDLSTPDFILLGASTGGISAIHKVLHNLGEFCPPILIVQHLDHKFSEEFLRGIEKVSHLKSGNLSKPLMHGHFYLSTEDSHLEIFKLKNQYYASLNPVPPPFVTHKPSVNQLFKSAVPFADKCWAILLTGMGSDGAQEMLHLRRHGAMTFTQDASSSLVYGMPKQAKKIGASVADITPLEMNGILLKLPLSKRKSA